MWALQALIFLIIGSISINAITYEVVPATEWWQTATVYQIWPRSFYDSDNDGIGDLNGIASKVDHFIDLGINLVWLSPFFASPMIDSGYDISNYIEVNPTYGTIEDFDNLVALFAENNIKVITDYVPNHTSDQHEWFQLSKAGVEPYTDYYVWNEGIVDANGTRQPPNNWLSNFGGSAWEWAEERQAYYYHQFASKQIDLNFTNPLVIQETKDILTFWLDHGIDGFRFDALPFLIEDPLLRDEPPSGIAGLLPTEYGYLDNIYTKDLQGTYDIMQIWSDHVANYSATKNDGKYRVVITEGYANISMVMKYFDYGSDVPFNFFFVRDQQELVVVLDEASDIADIINLWMGNMPTTGTANWQIGNHDNNRVASRFGTKSVDGLNFCLTLLPGIATIYNGDELGMIDTFLTWEETQDVRACNSDETRYTMYSRDPVRTPYQWDNTTSAGFSKNSTTELPVNDNYLVLNLAAQKEAATSHYKNVQAAIKLRDTTVIKEGSLTVEVIDDLVIGFTREYEGELPIAVLMNWSNTTEITVSLDVFENLPSQLEVLIADIYSGITVGTIYDKTSVTLPSKAAVVLRGISEEDC